MIRSSVRHLFVINGTARFLSELIEIYIFVKLVCFYIEADWNFKIEQNCIYNYQYFTKLVNENIQFIKKTLKAISAHGIALE